MAVGVWFLLVDVDVHHAPKALMSLPPSGYFLIRDCYFDVFSGSGEQVHEHVEAELVQTPAQQIVKTWLRQPQTYRFQRPWNTRLSMKTRFMGSAILIRPIAANASSASFSSAKTSDRENRHERS